MKRISFDVRRPNYSMDKWYLPTPHSNMSQVEDEPRYLHEYMNTRNTLTVPRYIRSEKECDCVPFGYSPKNNLMSDTQLLVDDYRDDVIPLHLPWYRPIPCSKIYNRK